MPNTHKGEWTQPIRMDKFNMLNNDVEKWKMLQHCFASGREMEKRTQMPTEIHLELRISEVCFAWLHVYDQNDNHDYISLYWNHNYLVDMFLFGFSCWPIDSFTFRFIFSIIDFFLQVFPRYSSMHLQWQHIPSLPFRDKTVQVWYLAFYSNLINCSARSIYVHPCILKHSKVPCPSVEFHK